MRISDWSSDVCSSDLRILPQSQAWVGGRRQTGFMDRCPTDGDARQDGFGRHGTETTQRAIYDPPERQIVSRIHRELQVGDRKSGVEGKSVSVRVALGGRRSIKKKKKKKTAKKL